MYLSKDTVIQCSHGGRLIPDRRHLLKLGNRRVLTRQAVLGGRIVKCPNNCERATEILAGAESEALNAPLLMNLEFLTDSTPPGRGVVLAAPMPVKRQGHASAVILTSLAWLLVCVAVAAGTYVYSQNELVNEMHELNDKNKELSDTLAADRKNYGDEKRRFEDEKAQCKKELEALRAAGLSAMQSAPAGAPSGR